MKDAYAYIVNELGLKAEDALVVAVSGGPDSMALLNLLISIKEKIGFRIICAHVNHNTGRVGQTEEQIFVGEYCKEHNVIFETMTISEYGDDNFHSEAHNKRYNYFEELITKYKAKYLFTAHHGDDLMETILMRVVRGSNLRGYSGFSKEVNKNTYKIVRPFINLTKQELEDYDKENNIKYYIDSSNLKDVYTRNRYRKYILPVLKKEDINVHKKFYKFSQTLLEYSDYIQEEVSVKIKNIFVNNQILINEFNKEKKVIRLEILYNIIAQVYGEETPLVSDRHIDLLMELIACEKASSQIDLPSGFVAIKEYNTLRIVREEQAQTDYQMAIDKKVLLPNDKIIEVVSSSLIDDNNFCFLSSNELSLPLFVRSRKDGDKIATKGMLGHEKVSDIFISKKVPKEQRILWPIVTDSSGEIVWIPGLKKSKFDRSKKEKYDIILRYY